ncbi:hypothetical protein [Pararobbsia silviterrae]|uniref:Histidine phosphatase family protein n=1 Tax=Pararobbsia silviterrae TaxID=1792498 RepID=A0A494Y7R5_9BURK|nr:hypothetical protein [Pararobbsia silviterrae]RKP58684.1 hypothetical protein D7S86_01720 [Pararobbsia silviterrae]
MKAIWATCVAAAVFTFSNACLADETIVFLRHGEKPAAGLGQLDCQGLQRSLRLPAVLNHLFGKPTAIFAPNPSIRKDDSGASYDYVRPLATIEPTAIAFSLPVNTDIGFKDTDRLRKALTSPDYANAVVFVAWEHHLARAAVIDLLKQYGADPGQVPKWNSNDFDSLYVVRLTTNADGSRNASFEHRRQQLDGLPTSCPGIDASM